MSAVLTAAALLGACDGSVRREGPLEAELQVLRVDAARNRLWVLDQETLTVYDNINGRRLRRMILPDWVLVGPRDACAPDLVLDASGAAIVSSNVLPVLWRIGAQKFEIERIELVPDSEFDKDFGFTALSFSSEGTLLAVGTTFPSFWELDTGAARARKLASYPPFPSACDPAALLRAAR